MILGLLRRLRFYMQFISIPLRQPVYMNRMTVVAGHFVFIDYIEQRWEKSVIPDVVFKVKCGIVSFSVITSARYNSKRSIITFKVIMAFA